MSNDPETLEQRSAGGKPQRGGQSLSERIQSLPIWPAVKRKLEDPRACTLRNIARFVKAHNCLTEVPISSLVAPLKRLRMDLLGSLPASTVPPDESPIQRELRILEQLFHTQLKRVRGEMKLEGRLKKLLPHTHKEIALLADIRRAIVDLRARHGLLHQPPTPSPYLSPPGSELRRKIEALGVDGRKRVLEVMRRAIDLARKQADLHPALPAGDAENNDGGPPEP